MDGVVAELLHLEIAKKQALIGLDSETFELSVRKQLQMIDGQGFSAETPADIGRLQAFSRTFKMNSALYENLMAGVPWATSSCRSYSGRGQIAETPAARGFSAEA